MLWKKNIIITHLLWTLACNHGLDMGEMYKDPMFNPMVQYEQAYVYYKYLCMQMDYKLKSKEYEKVCANNCQTDRKEKRIE